MATVFGPDILVRSLSVPSLNVDEYGNHWQYHSRSDRHSKIACWGILFDLLEACPLLAKQVAKGDVGFGINHEMSDFTNNRKKNLDLVLCTPTTKTKKMGRKPHSLRSLVDECAIKLTSAEKKILSGLPDIEEAPVGAVHVALEAKAAMTAHVKALPRLYDELNSSHQSIHGAADMAIAVGFVMVNLADVFVSSDRNKHDLKKVAANVSEHRQPADTLRVIEKVRQLPRRTRTGVQGFDGLALVVIDCPNDGSPVRLVTKSPSPPSGDVLEYESMINRIAQLYESRFPHA